MSRGEREVFSDEFARGPGSRFWERTQRASPPCVCSTRKASLFLNLLSLTMAWAHRTGFPGGSVLKESTCNAGNCLQCRRWRFDPWVRKIPWRRQWQPTPVFLPGESHGQRSLADYSPWGPKSQTRLSR